MDLIKWLQLELSSVQAHPRIFYRASQIFDTSFPNYEAEGVHRMAVQAHETQRYWQLDNSAELGENTSGTFLVCLATKSGFVRSRKDTQNLTIFATRTPED